MPRQPRPDLAGIPQHVVQRGNDGLPCFFREIDYERYRVCLREAALRYDVAIHAYVLMTNHVHLLATPAAVGAISRMMQHVGRRFVPYINLTCQRTGTLWEGRYKCSLVDSGAYLFACYRYIELNPVRAAMAVSPVDYPWSSHGANALGHFDPTVRPHADYLRLGMTEEDRLARYRGLFDDAISEDQIAELRSHLSQQRAYGNDRFQLAIECQLGRVMRVRPRGLPTESGK